MRLDKPLLKKKKKKKKKKGERENFQAAWQSDYSNSVSKKKKAIFNHYVLLQLWCTMNFVERKKTLDSKTR